MIRVDKATLSDFDAIYPLLTQFNNRYITKDDWKNLFLNLWNVDEDHSGYTLKDDDRVVGFLGLLFHERTAGNRKLRFCNMTSWIVEEGYRDKAVLLLYPLLRMKNYIITNFSPSDNVSLIMEKLKFKLFERNSLYIYPLPHPSLLFDRKTSKMRIIFDMEEIKTKLNDADLKLLNDHSMLACRHVLIECDGKRCYMIVRRGKKKGVPIGHVHYVSNFDLFFECLKKLKVLLPLKIKIAAITIDERFAVGRKLIGFSRSKHYKFFRSLYNDMASDPQFDGLYSELVILGI